MRVTESPLVLVLRATSSLNRGQSRHPASSLIRRNRSSRRGEPNGAQGDGNGLPPYLPEWVGAEVLADQLDTGELRRIAGELVKLVLAEDTSVLDSLPESVESALVTPLMILETARTSGDVVRLVVAARLVRRGAETVMEQCPPDVKDKLLRLPR